MFLDHHEKQIMFNTLFLKKYEVIVMENRQRLPEIGRTRHSLLGIIELSVP
jgi:hypothetical protein